MKCKWAFISILAWLILTTACSSDDPEPITGPVGPPPQNNTICKVQEIEYRNEAGEITNIHEFNYNINRQNRLESISIVEDLIDDPVARRFEFYYTEDNSVIPISVNEVVGADVQTTTNFRFSEDGNLTEFIQYDVASPTEPPQSHLFFYEASPLANDSINTRIIVFDIERLTRNWIDIFPAVFTSGGQRINRFERISFRGDLLEYCDFSYNDEGFLEQIFCRTVFGVPSEVWDFTYEQDRLISAFHQLPFFRDRTDYEYDNTGKPASLVSTTDGFFNWEARYFYICN